MSLRSSARRSTSQARRATANPAGPDLVCFTHLRWSPVPVRGATGERGNHRLVEWTRRFARSRRVLVFEEPVFEGEATRLDVHDTGVGILVATPALPLGMRGAEASIAQRRLLDAWLEAQRVRAFVAWYDTPMALAFSDHLEPRLVVYDCVDELSACQGAARSLRRREAEMMARAHVVLAAGAALAEAKRERHPSVHWVSDGIDANRFARGRGTPAEPAAQASLPRPRLGFLGPFDERCDLALVEGVAAARPEWSIVLAGAPATWAVRPNVHGVPCPDDRAAAALVAGWDVAILPYAVSRATRFVAPSLAGELLAAGRAVVATPVPDVVKPYAELGLVDVAGGMRAFIAGVERALADPGRDAARRQSLDALLARTSWESTWTQADAIVEEALAGAGHEGVARSRSAAVSA